jgi:hypothetical protein
MVHFSKIWYADPLPFCFENQKLYSITVNGPYFIFSLNNWNEYVIHFLFQDLTLHGRNLFLNGRHFINLASLILPLHFKKNLSVYVNSYPS